MKVRLVVVAAALVTLSSAWPLSAEDAPHAMYTPSSIKWGDAPPNLPKGAKLAVLYGDPSKDGLFVVRLRFPANYRIPAHSHPTDEIVTVLSGTFMAGLGDKLAPAAVKGFPTGSTIVAPANVNHFAMVKQPTVVEVSGMGPFVINYVNPADDPSKK